MATGCTNGQARGRRHCWAAAAWRPCREPALRAIALASAIRALPTNPGQALAGIKSPPLHRRQWHSRQALPAGHPPLITHTRGCARLSGPASVRPDVGGGRRRRRATAQPPRVVPVPPQRGCRGEIARNMLTKPSARWWCAREPIITSMCCLRPMPAAALRRRERVGALGR